MTEPKYPNRCTITMPEGDYPASWTVGRGWWLVAIPGGIPIPGKAEDAHNTGIDGTWESDVVKDDRTPTIHVVCKQIAESIVTEREQYGGMTLPFPMTVGEAEQAYRWRANYVASD